MNSSVHEHIHRRHPQHLLPMKFNDFTVIKEIIMQSEILYTYYTPKRILRDAFLESLCWLFGQVLGVIFFHISYAIKITLPTCYLHVYLQDIIFEPCDQNTPELCTPEVLIQAVCVGGGVEWGSYKSRFVTKL